MLKLNFMLIHQYKWSLSDVEGMIPWERDIFSLFLIQQLEKEAQQAKNKG